jgi:hypothetical protein
MSELSLDKAHILEFIQSFFQNLLLNCKLNSYQSLIKILVNHLQLNASFLKVLLIFYLKIFYQHLLSTVFRFDKHSR